MRQSCSRNDCNDDDGWEREHPRNSLGDPPCGCTCLGSGNPINLPNETSDDRINEGARARGSRGPVGNVASRRGGAKDKESERE